MPAGPTFRRIMGSRVASALATCGLLLPAAWHATTLARVLRARFPCPFDLDYLEDAHVYHAWRLAHGLPLYADPASGFATFPYPPLYWVALGASAKAIGFTDEAGRALSIASLLGSLAILSWQVARAAPSRLAAWAFIALAVAGVCAGYPTSDGSYDWVRSDTMAAFLVIAAASVAGDGRLSTMRACATGLLLALAIYTKQSGTVFAAWLIAFAFVRDRAGGVKLAAITGLACIVPLVWLEVESKGWFLRWLFYPSHQPLHPWWAALGALGTFVLRAPFLPLVPWLVIGLRRRGWLRPTTTLWAGLWLVAAAGGALASVKQFCCGNVWIPELLLAWPVALMLAGDWLCGAGAGNVRTLRRVFATGAVLLVPLVYDASAFMPGPDRWLAAQRLEQLVKGLDGGVVVTTVPMAGVRAGGPRQQPVLSTYEDARSGGVDTDYVAALAGSGARWVVTTDRYAGTDRAPEPRMAPYFTRVETLDFDLRSLASWDKPKNVVLWRRTATGG